MKNLLFWWFFYPIPGISDCPSSSIAPNNNLEHHMQKDKQCIIKQFLFQFKKRARLETALQKQQYQVLSPGGSTPKKTKALETQHQFLVNTVIHISHAASGFLEGSSYCPDLRQGSRFLGYWLHIREIQELCISLTDWCFQVHLPHESDQMRAEVRSQAVASTRLPPEAPLLSRKARAQRHHRFVFSLHCLKRPNSMQKLITHT